MMRALSVADGFGLERIALRAVPRPSPGPDEVLVRVRAASLNYRDLLVARGSYNPRFPLPLTLGSDAVGDVVEAGDVARTRGITVGTRVLVHMVQGWLSGPPERSATQRTLGGPLHGVFAEYVLSRADSILPAPAYLEDVEAACLPCAALTAMSALQDNALLVPGATLLTQGSGGVSLFALALGLARGLRVIVTSRSEEKRERLLALGAHEVLLTAGGGWGRRARALSGPEGVDHVVDVVGGPSLPESLSAVRPGGTISLIGTLSGNAAELDILPIVMRNVRVQGVFVGSVSTFQRLLGECERAQIRPVVDSVYELGDAARAFERLASGEHIGKICLRMG